MENKENVLKEKLYRFALRIVNLCKFLTSEKKEYVLSKQVLRSGTSVGANVVEGNQAQSKSDFVHKLSISLKESVETQYWLDLLRDSDYITADPAHFNDSRLSGAAKDLNGVDQDSKEQEHMKEFSIFRFPLNLDEG